MKKLLVIFIVFISVISISNSYVLINGKNEFSIEPETLKVEIEKDGIKETISFAQEKKNVSDLIFTKQNISFQRENIDFKFEIIKDHLKVSINSKNKSQIKFPIVSAKEYLIPIKEGKLIPANDETYLDFYNGFSDEASRFLSMSFIGNYYENYASLFVYENLFNNKINFENKDNKLNYNFIHTFTALDKTEIVYKFYIKDKNINDIAKEYREYVIQKNMFKSLDEKNKENSNVSKLYGAPHIYLWDNSILSVNNVKNWRGLQQKLKKDLNSDTDNLTKKLLNIYENNLIEESKELEKTLLEFTNAEWVYKYLQASIVTGITRSMYLKELYTDEFHKYISDKSLLNPKTTAEIVNLNKNLVYNYYKNYVEEIENWGDGLSNYLINDLYNSGIQRAWLGIDNWETGFGSDQIIKNANDKGYIIGAYDSYHSIHKPGKARWITADFQDKKLFYSSTFKNENGEYLTGFLGEGRLLNPVYSIEAVKNRMSNIMSNNIAYNSWFVDVDATGFFYEDYTKGHETTRKMDMKFRLKRMEYIKNEYNLIMGSEDGFDFANKVITYAHGMTSPVMEWSDPDLRQKKDSKYYLGKYWAPKGVPSRYIKEVPLKERHRTVYFDMRYNVPLYELVYHDSQISSHHWEMGSMKAVEEVKNVKLKEILYAIPPLYHLDREYWAKYKESIVDHIKVWGELHSKVGNREMTSFENLTKNRLIQKTEFDDIKVIANFSEVNYKYDKYTIEPTSAIIIYEDKIVNYKPK
ncbi:MAG: glycoside hydrolase [Thermotogota bacterium]